MAQIVSISDQIKCIEREISKRKYVYPRSVANGKMTQKLADKEIEHMRAVLATLTDLINKQEFELT